jgi:hypothetical protein
LGGYELKVEAMDNRRGARLKLSRRPGEEVS